MSRIDKLSILGIRAFDNKKSETIQFQAPLTLIVGSNGSGKTTIIECLKYVTAGETPPNSKGGAFIHDPKLCGEKEVMANVKMSFVSAEGVHMVVSKAMLLTVKKASRSVKALEGSVKMKKGGETNTISSRVGEMNQMMPRFLGVSKAVLESVIFCHQDESLWPLMEPAKLKERFDEIFEALKYTKAIENIKILQKTKKAELIQHNADEQHLRVNNEKGKKLEERTQKLQDSSDRLREEADEVTKKIQEAVERINHAFDQTGRASTIVGELKGKRIERATKEENIESLRENLVEMTDSDEELERMLSQYEHRVSEYEEDLQLQKGRYQSLGEEVQDTRNQLGAKERECGALEAEKHRHEYQIQERKKLVQETARKHDIRGFDLDVDDKQAQNFVSRITAIAREQNAVYERTRQETQDELKRIQRNIDEINSKRSTSVQKKDSARHTIAAHDRKIESLQNQLKLLSADEGTLVAIRSRLEETQHRLEKEKSSSATSTLEQQLESFNGDLQRLEGRKERLDAELVEVTRRAGDSAQLDLVTKTLKDRQRSLQTMCSAHGDKISSTLDHAWSPASIESDFQRALSSSTSRVSEAERQRDGAVREMEQVDFQYNRCQTEFRTKQLALQTAAKVIRDAVECEPQDYLEEVQQLESTRDILRADTDSFQMLSNYFEACLKTAKEHKACKTCMRSLKSEKELEVLIRTVEKERQKVKGSLSDDDVQQVEEDLKAARAVSTDFDTWERLREKEIPALEKEQQQLTENREQLVAQVEDYDNVVGERKAVKREVDALSRTVQTIVKYQEEIVSLEEQLKELETKSKAAGLSRGLEVIQNDVQVVNEDLRTTKTRVAEASSMRDRQRNLINGLELETRDIQAKYNTAEYQLKEKQSLEGQIEEFKFFRGEQREALQSADVELQSLVPELSTAQAKYDDAADRGATRERELASETTELKTSINKVSAIDQEIRDYTSSGQADQLRIRKSEADDLKAGIIRLETDQDQIVREVKALEDHLHNHSGTKRSIIDNQRYRRDLQQLNAVRKEIAELETHNAEEETAHWEREGIEWQTERHGLSAQLASTIAQIKVIDDQILQNLKDWDTDYKDAAHKYREAHVHAETTKAAIEDLGRYAGALDKAIMKYHSLKMEEINRIIEELWRRTYQGTDVDSILIRSESEAGKSNKSYNYRVCMVKQDVEMDMRGRCSAGQKVLACIIIRLALAECFGVNCGLIALDEPTTNLDAENIRALAESLNEIIRVRRAQRNFQLIVITHDEEFLRYMGCSDFTDVYYRISRDDEQNSKIERRNIAEVL